MVTPPSLPPVQWALLYARRGWSVVAMHSVDSSGSCTCGRIDCPSPSKHPHIRWEHAMSQPATEDELRHWWTLWPEANVGVVTGSVSGVATIDIDPRHGGDETLTRLEGFPPTLESVTGGGGRHLWYARPDRELPSVELDVGVELKAEGGLIVAPPSRHASGQSYRWLNYSHELAPLPRWVSHLAIDPSEGRQDIKQQGPIRTAQERAEFQEAWARAGIDLADGEAHYLCPFHDDHHPSLHIDADGCRWYCFACRIGGSTGRLLRELGLPRRPTARSRMKGWVGKREPVTISGEVPVEVVGESFHQDELLSLAGGNRRFGGVDLEAVAALVPVEGNGIEVRIDDMPIGYLSQIHARRFTDLVEEIIEEQGLATARASIRGGWDRGGGDIGMFGVTLSMPEQPGVSSDPAHRQDAADTAVPNGDQ
ncbi:MAG: bifunctional DNA primase/polymerase [Acidimicrobiia bacterium]